MAECFRLESCFLLQLIWITLLFHSVTEATDRNIAHEFSLVKQTSTDLSWAAERAVDNDPETCAQTKQDGVWKLDLGDVRIISSVQIAGTGGETYNVHISEDESTFKTNASLLGPVCRFGTSGKKESCFVPASGRYISITTEPAGNELNICDVKLFECDDGFYGPKCEDECHCVGEEVCSKDFGKCDGGCAPGYKGEKCNEECPSLSFGLNCAFDCHCQFGGCDGVTGFCSSDCHPDWIGPSCQTEIPVVADPPKFYAKTPNAITITWPVWIGPLGNGYSLQYAVMYRERGVWNWNDADSLVANKVGAAMNYYTVHHLKLNAYYAFKIQPILDQIGGEPMKLEISQPLEYAKTDCAAPDALREVDALTGKPTVIKDGSSATMVIRWEPPGEINCDTILYYNIEYRSLETPYSEWKTSRAQFTEVNATIEELDFETNYEARVMVLNNYMLSSQPAELRFKTGVAPVVTGAMPITDRAGNNFVIVGVVIGCVVIMVVVLAVVFYRRRKAKYLAIPVKEEENNAVKLNSMVKVEVDASRTDDSGLGGEGSSGSTPTAEILDPVLDMPSRPDLVPDNDVIAPSTPPIREPIHLDDLEEYVLRGRENDNADLVKEYKEIPEGFTNPHDWGKREENKHKNRFINIIAYDHSRVILDLIEGDPDSDYVNANYIDGYKGPKSYIASQGCTKYTIQDMWRMVWQVKSTRIIMVTNLVENGKRKCEQYWSDHDNVEKFYGDIGVTVLDLEQTSDFNIRTFNIRKGDEHRNVKQFHFTAWPDHGVPNRTSPIIHFRRKVRSYDETHPGLLTVHCSAGVGRTGTFIALDYLLDQAVAEKIIDVYGLTQRMRRDRVNMIQTAEQYVFVYDALLEALKSGNTTIPSHTFREVYEDLCHVNPETGKSKLQVQYETLQTMSPKVKIDDCALGQLEENQGKNRYPDVLPADRYRPYLMTRVQGTNDYINAVFLDGYKSKNAYILTQMPLPHTVIDLWRMIHEHKVGSIVMLNPWNEDDNTYGQYWPGENQECECGPFVIESCTVDATNPNITIRELKLQYTPESPKLGNTPELESRKVNHFQLNCWPADSIKPNKPHSLIGLIDLVERSQLKTGNGPIVIHCHDGVKHSGVYAAVSSIWEKMKIEQEVDIFQAVKYLRFHRPQVIHDLDQYQFCYEMVLAYLAEFETYANFR